jgi:hypothetical protein
MLHPVSANPLDATFDSLSECADRVHGRMPQPLALERVRAEFVGCGVPVDVPIGWLKEKVVRDCWEVLADINNHHGFRGLLRLTPSGRPAMSSARREEQCRAPRTGPRREIYALLSGGNCCQGRVGEFVE